MNATTPTSDSSPTRDLTLGELLISALSAEQARENNRRTLERVAAQSSFEAAILSTQMAALNAGDPFDNIPTVAQLRAYANNEFGKDFTPEVVRRIRGRVCESLDIDTNAADALPLARVVDALRSSPEVDTRPDRVDVSRSLPPVGADELHRDFRWLRVRQVARLFDLNPGAVTKTADKGTFITNGKIGHERRIDVLSVIRQQLAQLEAQENGGE